jgi:hypothetical protein
MIVNKRKKKQLTSMFMMIPIAERGRRSEGEARNKEEIEA